MSVVPKVWKRIMVTFICNFVTVFAYNIVAVVIAVFAIVILQPSASVGETLLLFNLIIYFVGLLYITMIWQLASVVSVLEESYGVNAMSKSQALIKGTMDVSAAIFFVLGLCFVGVEVIFKIFASTLLGGILLLLSCFLICRLKILKKYNAKPELKSDAANGMSLSTSLDKFSSLKSSGKKGSHITALEYQSLVYATKF